MLPSQEKRVQASKEQMLKMKGNGMGTAGAGAGADGGGGNGGSKKRDGGKSCSLVEDTLEGHGSDPALRRTGKLFGGLVADLKRKLPYVKSDFTDALNLQCVATFCFMYFALLAPIVTFGGLLEVGYLSVCSIITTLGIS